MQPKSMVLLCGLLFLPTLMLACNKSGPTKPPAEKVVAVQPSPEPAAVDASKASAPSSEPKAEEPVPAEVVTAVAETPPAIAEKAAWLAWRQDVEGKLVTALLLADDPNGAGEANEIVELRGSLLVFGAGALWELTPLVQRWPLQPCGEEGEGISKALRVSKLGLEPGAAAAPLSFELAESGFRPNPGDSAMHTEVLVFGTQLGQHVTLRHVTITSPCPVPATGLTFVVDQVLDLERGELREPLELPSEEELTKVREEGLLVAVDKVRETWSELSVEAVGAVLLLESWEGKWSDAGIFELEWRFSGMSELFGEEDPSGDVPYEQAWVPADKPLAAFGELGTAPEVVRAFWQRERKADEGKSVTGDEMGLYDGVGWAKLPAELVPVLRAELGRPR